MIILIIGTWAWLILIGIMYNYSCHVKKAPDLGTVTVDPRWHREHR